MGKEQPLLKITISGPGVKPGRISLPVLLKICQEAQEAVNRQAQAIEERAGGSPDSRTAIQECTLELIALKKGSTTLDFGPANKQPSLIPEIASLGFEAVSEVATTLRALNQKRGKWKAPDPRILDALDDLGSVFNEGGINKLQWTAPSSNPKKRKTAELVPSSLKKIRQRKQEKLPLNGGSPMPHAAETVPEPDPPERPIVQESFLEGMLEAMEGKVRITPAAGPSSTLTYSADKFENVLGALHKPVRVKVDMKARKLVDIEVTEAPHLFDTTNFFNSRSIDQLIAEQHIQPITDISVLSGAIPDEDVDEFVAEIYRDRMR